MLGVTFAERTPRMYHPHRLIEMDSGGAAPINPEWPAGYRVSSAAVAPTFFEVLDAPILAGRGFGSGDVMPESRAVIVNDDFVRLVLGGRNPVGRHLRYIVYEEWEPSRREHPEPGPWFEIVGVVPTMGMSAGEDPKSSGIYHPMLPGSVNPVEMVVHLRGAPAAFEPVLRRAAAQVEATLRVDRVVPMSRLSDDELMFTTYWTRLLLGVSVTAIVLSLAGIYAVMTFTVVRRTREVGIRIALGANARRVVLDVFRRPLTQIVVGVATGSVLLATLLAGSQDWHNSVRAIAMLALYALGTLAVCLLACMDPTRRALRVEPTEALRADG